MPDFRPAPATLPPGIRVYAVGDVHGCLRQLAVIHAAVAEDLAARPIQEPWLIHLGDYVDRGPDTAGVVARLAEAEPPVGISAVVNLIGNHEELMLAAVDTPTDAAVQNWMMNGGANSLHSWGIALGTDPATWAARIPPAHLAFLRSLSLRHTLGGYLFVHAGLRPGVPLAQQSRHDQIWIREPFLSSAADLGCVVVHGHTPRVRPEIRRNRIGIDTGAVMGGVLTCAVLEADRVAFLQTESATR
jgi:serine/threonine protein phosphatase 1